LTERSGKTKLSASNCEEAEVLKYRNIEYGVEEDVPGRWRYIIYPKIGTDARVYGDAKDRTREAP
jgi:hypothetical protein